jgi:hypothetical protein
VRSEPAAHVLPLVFFVSAQACQGDLMRAAIMTASQVMLGYGFIPDVYYHPATPAWNQ